MHDETLATLRARFGNAITLQARESTSPDGESKVSIPEYFPQALLPKLVTNHWTLHPALLLLLMSFRDRIAPWVEARNALEPRQRECRRIEVASMKRTQVVALTLLFLGATVRANADIIDFVGMANGATGESAWNTLTVDLFGNTAKVDITGYDGGPRYAYLDRGFGGLGVCEVLTAGAAANTTTNSGNNLCNPSNDDNVTNAPEFLSFIFDTDVVVDGIWVNNNHDGDGSMRNNSILINNASYSFVNNGGAGINSFNGNSYAVSAGQAFTIGYGGVNDEAFYVSQMSVRAVPEPLTLLLLGTGLLGVGARNRRRQQKH